MSAPGDQALLAEEGRELLRIARATLREYFASGMIPPGAPHRKVLLALRGTFVTLRKRDGGDLRGCVGTTFADRPLYRAVQEYAVAAATRDPRFPPVEPTELTGIGIEVSILGPSVPLVDPVGALVVGEHGVEVEGRGRRGLLLPEVARDHGWDAAELLAQTCRKAGLPAAAWRDGDVRLLYFSTQKFSEMET